MTTSKKRSRGRPKKREGLCTPLPNLAKMDALATLKYLRYKRTNISVFALNLIAGKYSITIPKGMKKLDVYILITMGVANIVAATERTQRRKIISRHLVPYGKRGYKDYEGVWYVHKKRRINNATEVLGRWLE